MTGFRVISPVKKVFGSLKTSVKAKDFEPDVLLFLKRSLTTAIQLTPARSAAVIRRAQKKQYAARVNYIPTIHELQDPTLIVNDEDEHWIFSNNKWYRGDWNLPDDVYSAYGSLLEERNRRLETSESEFVEGRVQARFLFKKSWWEIGQSVGIDVSCPAEVKTAITRRKPPLNPPKGYAQKRGGKGVYSVVVRNPFLDQTSAGGQSSLSTIEYKQFNGQDIINRAMDQHRAKFEENISTRLERLILSILKFL